MAATDPKVMALVASELEKNPDVSVEDLYSMAKKANRGVARMSRRQFHARYPLQIKRKQGAAKRASAGKAGRAISFTGEYDELTLRNTINFEWPEAFSAAAWRKCCRPCSGSTGT